MTPARFAFLFFLAAIGAGALYRTATWAQALPCQENRGAGTFMAYCPTNQYGDYEHGAYYYNLEPEAVKSLQAAKVIVVGNSRTQIAFSTDPVDEYFRARRLPYYLMGFGYDEHVDFAQLLIKRYRLKPEILIINSDPFFSHGSTFDAGMVAPLNAETLLPKIGSWLGYHEKHLFNALQAGLCDHVAGLCSQSVGAIYRETRTGVWHSSAFWVWTRDISTPIDVKALIGIILFVVTRDGKFQPDLRRDVPAFLAVTAVAVWSFWANLFIALPLASAISFVFLFNIFRVTSKSYGPIERIGRASYSMYIFHFFFATFATKAILKASPDLTLWPNAVFGATLAITVLMTYLIARMSEKLIEHRFIKYGRALTRSPPSLSPRAT